MRAKEKQKQLSRGHQTIVEATKYRLLMEVELPRKLRLFYSFLYSHVRNLLGFRNF
eukprot:TRINITY_DN2074_c0_g1_i1.p1 TRINITY_DN2074_c0_g1~~TRINITY_DN2074_c0_g1_i1.p1  ORF type:complete len:56 (+),score=3.54 TRINITY_DN2074_c0_g1_i1:15-182(+)